MEPNYIYYQSTGKLVDASTNELIGVGYSGNTTGLNNPEAQEQHNIGPIPQGLYTISNSINHPKVGPVAMYLTPFKENDMFGRSGFLIHGDNAEQNHSASEGCIILPRTSRLQISNDVMLGKFILQVVA